MARGAFELVSSILFLFHRALHVPWLGTTRAESPSSEMPGLVMDNSAHQPLLYIELAASSILHCQNSVTAMLP